MKPLTQKDQIAPYLFDASQFSGAAEKVFLPENEKEISELLAEANQKKIPVTVSGGRTGLTGAAVPLSGWVISTEKLNRIMEIKKAGNSWARLQPALLLKEIQKALDPHAIFYPPDPTGPKAFLGGTVGTNASGPNSFKYGTTRRYVRRMRVVLASGEVLDLRRGQIIANQKGILEIHAPALKFSVPHYSIPRIKHAGGYFVQPKMDAVDLFIGSEGTLGVTTEIEIGLLPKPEQVLTFMIFFAQEEDSWKFVKNLRRESRGTARRAPTFQITIQPRVLEYFDSGSLKFLRPGFPAISKSANACLFIEQETGSKNEKQMLGLWHELFTKFGAVEIWEGDSLAKQEEFRNFRSALPLAVKDFLAQHHQVKIGTDTCVPDERFEELMLFHRQKAEEGGFQTVTFGHIGESHVHLNILPRSDDEAGRGRALYPELVNKALALGGTFSAEHGVGKLKRRYLTQFFGPQAVKEMLLIKRTFDPNLILGPGNLFEIQ